MIERDYRMTLECRNAPERCYGSKVWLPRPGGGRDYGQVLSPFYGHSEAACRQAAERVGWRFDPDGDVTCAVCVRVETAAYGEAA